MKLSSKIILTIMIAAIVLSEPAYAYLDPGTGSMVVQILVACFATVVIFFKSIWQGITQFFGKKPKTGDTEEAEDSEDEE